MVRAAAGSGQRYDVLPETYWESRNGGHDGRTALLHLKDVTFAVLGRSATPSSAGRANEAGRFPSSEGSSATPNASMSSARRISDVMTSRLSVRAVASASVIRYGQGQSVRTHISPQDCIGRGATEGDIGVAFLMMQKNNGR